MIKGSGTCLRPLTPALADQLPLLLNMPGMLAQVRWTPIPIIRMLYYHTARIFSLVDFTDPNNTGKDTRRLYFPWDLDAVFQSTTGSIYASGSGRKVAPPTYQEVILRHPTFRAKYNQIMLNLVNSPLSVANVQAFLSQAEAVISSALANDPFPTRWLAGRRV